jgi:HlyD family secretion protein
MTWLKRGLFLIVALALVAVGGAWLMGRSNGGPAGYRTGTLTRTDVVATIGSTGTVEPEEVVDVGAQVAGQISAFGTDADGKQVDHGSRVKADALLAQIDDSLYRSDVAVADAQVAAAKAGVQRAEADLKSAQAKFYQAERDWARAQKLGPSEALAEFSYDAYKAVYEGAAAAVSVADAAIAQAKGAVAQAEATLFRAQRNLGYTTIKSPIDGVIIERRVNIGQTVVASLNAPSLFLLAKDMTHMQVWVSVNEADIGRIHPGQPVTFTVDTFPGRTFKGSVRKIRPKAEMSQNVVTYLVEVSTDNADGTLWPYLTANVQFEVTRSDNVLAVPNSALRYAPDDERIAPDAREAYAAAMKEMDAGSGGGPAAGGGEGRKGGKGKGKRRGGDASLADSTPTSQPSSQPAHVVEYRKATVWVRDGQFLRPVFVTAGNTDGILTEVRGDGLTEGMEVITGEETAEEAAARNTNPFGPPQFGRPSGRRSGGM